MHQPQIRMLADSTEVGMLTLAIFTFVAYL